MVGICTDVLIVWDSIFFSFVFVRVTVIVLC